MVFLLIPILCYLVLILWIAHHWFHSKDYTVKESRPQTCVSVLIPFRNEASHLPHLMRALKNQSYPEALVEYLFINDHSTDGGEVLVKDFPCFLSTGSGKKGALKTGLQHATGDLIVTLDADCVVGESWLSTIVAFYEEQHADLIICPVKIVAKGSLWSKIQALEFQSLAASTGGAALGGMPIMCNGANLAFRKQLTDSEQDVFNAKYVSGDDMFLLEYAKHHKAKIAYLKSPLAMVQTHPESWISFWKQRSRWTSKSTGYHDAGIIVSGAVVFCANLSLLIFPFVSLDLYFWSLFAKFLCDVLLLSVSASFFSQQKLIWLTILLTPVYPFYVLIVLLRGLVRR